MSSYGPNTPGQFPMQYLPRRLIQTAKPYKRVENSLFDQIQPSFNPKPPNLRPRKLSSCRPLVACQVLFTIDHHVSIKPFQRVSIICVKFMKDDETAGYSRSRWKTPTFPCDLPRQKRTVIRTGHWMMVREKQYLIVFVCCRWLLKESKISYPWIAFHIVYFICLDALLMGKMGIYFEQRAIQFVREVIKHFKPLPLGRKSQNQSVKQFPACQEQLIVLCVYRGSQKRLSRG